VCVWRISIRTVYQGSFLSASDNPDGVPALYMKLALVRQSVSWLSEWKRRQKASRKKKRKKIKERRRKSLQVFKACDWKMKDIDT